jgi:hypothetical protein
MDAVEIAQKIDVKSVGEILPIADMVGAILRRRPRMFNGRYRDRLTVSSGRLLLARSGRTMPHVTAQSIAQVRHGRDR